MLTIFIFNTTLLDQTEVFLWKYVLEKLIFFTVNDFCHLSHAAFWESTV